MLRWTPNARRKLEAVRQLLSLRSVVRRRDITSMRKGKSR
jgi:hypothetical protein